MTEEEKTLIKEIIETFSGRDNLNYCIELNMGNEDVVLGVSYEDEDEYLIEIWGTIREEEKDVKFAEEMYWYIRENVDMDEVESILMFSKEG